MDEDEIRQHRINPWPLAVALGIWLWMAIFYIAKLAAWLLP